MWEKVYNFRNRTAKRCTFIKGEETLSISKKDNLRPLTITLVVVSLLMTTFLIIAPLLFGERCSPSHSGRVYMPQGTGQIIGPVITETCNPPFIILPERIAPTVLLSGFHSRLILY